MSVMLASQYQDEWVEENLTGRFEINSVLFDIGLCFVTVPFERDAMKPNSYVHIQIQTYDNVYTLPIQEMPSPTSIPTSLPETPQSTDQTRRPSQTHR